MDRLRNTASKEEYLDAERSVKKAIRSAKRSMEKRLAREKVGNSRPFFSYVKKKTKTKVTVGPIKKESGELTSDVVEMAEELNKFFGSVYTRENTTNIPEPERKRTRTKLTNSWLTTAKVNKKIKNLRTNSAAGPDGISPKLLQECSDQLAPVLTMIYKKSLDQGIVPEEWKQAKVVPIYKKGSKTSPGNYRPVSLTCVCCM